MTTIKNISLVFAVFVLSTKSYCQVLTKYNAFEDVQTTKNIINICSKSWDTLYMFASKDYFYIDTNCLFKQPKFCLESIKHDATPILLSDDKRKILLNILSNEKSYLSIRKVAPNIEETTGCHNNFEYNVFFILKSRNGRVMIFYCAKKENNYSLLYQEDRISYILWNSCINFEAHNKIFSVVGDIR